MAEKPNGLSEQHIDHVADTLHTLMFPNNDDEHNLKSALEQVDIKVTYFVSDELDGFLKWDSVANQPIISVNALQSEVSRNFSMAHELGHLVMTFKWLPFNAANLRPSDDYPS